MGGWGGFGGGRRLAVGGEAAGEAGRPAEGSCMRSIDACVHAFSCTPPCMRAAMRALPCRMYTHHDRVPQVLEDRVVDGGAWSRSGWAVGLIPGGGQGVDHSSATEQTAHGSPRKMIPRPATFLRKTAGGRAGWPLPPSAAIAPAAAAARTLGRCCCWCSWCTGSRGALQLGAGAPIEDADTDALADGRRRGWDARRSITRRDSHAAGCSVRAARCIMPGPLAGKRLT
jgi:hypothetical protein